MKNMNHPLKQPRPYGEKYGDIYLYDLPKGKVVWPSFELQTKRQAKETCPTMGAASHLV